jgi:hypothetical protein
MTREILIDSKTYYVPAWKPWKRVYRSKGKGRGKRTKWVLR